MFRSLSPLLLVCRHHITERTGAQGEKVRLLGCFPQNQAGGFMENKEICRGPRKALTLFAACGSIKP